MSACAYVTFVQVPPLAPGPCFRPLFTSHDPHAEEIPGEAEISVGEGPKIPKENRRETMRVEQCRAGHGHRFLYHLRRHLHRIHPRRPPLVDHGLAGLKSLQTSDPTRTDSIHASKFVGSVLPCFPSHHRSLTPSAQYKEVASEEAAEGKGGTCKGSASMGSCTQGIDCGGLPAGVLQRRVQCGAEACGTAEMGQERWHVDCVNPVKHRQVKLMAWGQAARPTPR